MLLMQAAVFLYIRELRSAFRERNLLLYTVLIPLLMYPLVLWLFAGATTLIEGQREQQQLRVAVLGPASEALLERLATEPASLVVEIGQDEAQARTRLSGGELEIILFVEPHATPDAPSNFAARVLFHGASARSRTAVDRIEQALAEHREAMFPPGARTRPFEIESINLAEDEDMGLFLIGTVVPATMLVMICMGAIYPAIDTLAGERERQTWETSLTLGCSRASLAWAKYLYVVTMGALSGLLNIVGMWLALSGILTLSLPWTAIPGILLCNILLAALVAALVLLPIAFARTFREGQTWASPVLLALCLPALVATLPADGVGLAFAFAPAANLVLVFSQLVQGIVRPDFILVTVLVSGLVIGSALAVLAWLFRSESLLLGLAQGSWRHRWVMRLLR